MSTGSINVFRLMGALFLGLFALSACTSGAPPAPKVVPGIDSATPDYVIGPYDGLTITVWKAPELSTGVTVRPDGRISVPLIQNMQAAGKTPSQLSRDIQRELTAFVKDPIVTVIVSGFQGDLDQQIRVIGAAVQPKSLPYRSNMTVLDVMTAVGGLAEFAAGNRAKLIRTNVDGTKQEYSLRLDSLLRNGKLDANAVVLPGDIILIPESRI